MSTYIVFYSTNSIDYRKKYPADEVGRAWADDHNKRIDLFDEVEQCAIEAYSEEDAREKFDSVHQVMNDPLSDKHGHDALILRVGLGTFLKAIEV